MLSMSFGQFTFNHQLIKPKNQSKKTIVTLAILQGGNILIQQQRWWQEYAQRWIIRISLLSSDIHKHSLFYLIMCTLLKSFESLKDVAQVLLKGKVIVEDHWCFFNSGLKSYFNRKKWNKYLWDHCTWTIWPW